ncbi:uncharacterized protein LACBIDRAFT_333188 [Laccaria bicolor S238N-H82]|uniref:Predicted protein n=1 Tax=Laccaria bicolor (strain S238N-H82 / ATCC MYA-4686) TaxID=486041 RepID=B0DV65_LACBS|nr:uncharacterized protein LACBIDRAFT_333188 [Laccaria bicolor S238N-H82]EDR01457.1 predicted protein [Laccaria bicolor S238N-H82]|eukprot:XP_001887809.1 predicted protein [Laccaria bicolor S238N-H82]
MFNFSSFLLSLRRQLMSTSFTKVDKGAPTPKKGDVVEYWLKHIKGASKRQQATSRFVGKHASVISHVDHNARMVWLHCVSRNHPANPPWQQPARWYHFAFGALSLRPHIVPFERLSLPFRNVGKFSTAQLIRDSDAYGLLGSLYGWKIGKIEPKEIESTTSTRIATTTTPAKTTAKEPKKVKAVKKMEAANVKREKKAKRAKTVEKAKAAKVKAEATTKAKAAKEATKAKAAKEATKAKAAKEATKAKATTK